MIACGFRSTPQLIVVFTITLIIIFYSSQGLAKDKGIIELLARQKHIFSQSPLLLKTLTSIKYYSALTKIQDAKQGWSIFGRITSGRYSELVTPTSDRDRLSNRNYLSNQWQIGLQYPLFGSNTQQKESILTAELALVDAKAKKYILMISLKRRLIRSYSDYVFAQRVILLATEFLSDEQQVKKRLSDRTNYNYILASDKAAFDLYFLNAHRLLKRASSMSQTAITQISFLVGEPITKPLVEVMVFPNMQLYLQLDQNRWINESNLYRSLSQKLTEIKSQKKPCAFDAIDSTFSVSVSEIHANDVDMAGSSFSASLSISMPLNLLGASTALISARNLREIEMEHEHRELALSLRDELATLKGELTESVYRYQQTIEQVSIQNRVLQEKKARLTLLAGDVFEQYISAKNTHFEKVLESYFAYKVAFNVFGHFNQFWPAAIKIENDNIETNRVNIEGSDT